MFVARAIAVNAVTGSKNQPGPFSRPTGLIACPSATELGFWDAITGELELSIPLPVVAIVEEGSLGAGARKVGMAQPNASRAIAELEADMKAELASFGL